MASNVFAGIEGATTETEVVDPPAGAAEANLPGSDDDGGSGASGAGDSGADKGDQGDKGGAADQGDQGGDQGDQGQGDKAGDGDATEADLGSEEELALEAELHGGDKAKLLQSVNQTLTEAYATYPKLKPFLNEPENKGLRNQFFRMAEMNKVFPTVYHAREASQKATDLDNFDNLFYSEEPADAVNLVRELQSASGKDGQDTGAFGRLRSAVVADYLAEALELAEKNPAKLQQMGIDPAQLRIAVLLAGNYGKLDGFGLPKGALKAIASGAQPNETPEQKALRQRAEKLEADEAAFAAKQKTGVEQEKKLFEAGVLRNFGSWVSKETDALLAKATGLAGDDKAGLREIIKEVVMSRVERTVHSDTALNSLVLRLMKSGGRRPETAEKILRELKVRGRQAFGQAGVAVLKKIGSGIMAAQADADKRRTEGASRREAAGSGAPGKVSRPAAETKNNGAPTGGFRKQAMDILAEADTE